MHEQLIDALIASPNAAADDALLEALALGNSSEKTTMLDALLRRKTVRGLSGVVARYEALDESLQLEVLQNIKILHSALRECGRSDDKDLRLSAMKLIAFSRQGKLAYVLSENLYDSDEKLSKAAVESVVAMARWVATGTRRLQRRPVFDPPAEPSALELGPVAGDAAAPDPEQSRLYADLMEQRVEIEMAVARAMDVHRGKHGADLLRAALLLCDNPASKTLAILNTAKHGGQSSMVRRLQQAPASEHVEAFLLGASHGQLRLHFGSIFAQIDEAPVLDGLLRKTHWLKDHQLQICMHQVARGTWWQEAELLHDIDRRDPEDACRIGEWLAASGMHDVMQDQRMARLLERAQGNFGGRLRLLRIAIRRKRGASVHLLRQLLSVPDERLVRMTAREIVRRKPVDFENMLLQLMTAAPKSVRRVISRAIGQAGFEHYWQRFDRLDKPTRKHAGRAMMKLLPDAVQRLGRRLAAGPIDQRLKALQMTQELGLAEPLRQLLTVLSAHSNAKVRSKTVCVLGDLAESATLPLLERVLSDSDSRVRANAIEVLENRKVKQFVPMLVQRARSNHNRERANAIKALHRMQAGNIGTHLLAMLRDERPEHRVSAMWALKQIGWWKLLQEVGNLAKGDGNLRVRRYAVGVLKGVAEMFQTTAGKAG